MFLDLGFEIRGFADVRRRQGGRRRYAVARLAMGPNSSLDEIALITASRYVRTGQDSALGGTWSDVGFNDTTIINGAVPPNNTLASPITETRPEFEVNIQSMTSIVSNLESMRSLESYVPETSVESLEDMETSPTLQERSPVRVRDALNSSLLTSQAVSSPPNVDGEATGLPQPININLFAPYVPHLSPSHDNVTGRRRSRSLGSNNRGEVDRRTFTVVRDGPSQAHQPASSSANNPSSPSLGSPPTPWTGSPVLTTIVRECYEQYLAALARIQEEEDSQPKKKKRGRETANLSDLSDTALGATPDLSPERQEVPSPVAGRLRPRRPLSKRPAKKIVCKRTKRS